MLVYIGKVSVQFAFCEQGWITKFQSISSVDYSFGSSIFTVKPPVADQLWYGNTLTISESPFIVKYQDKDYQRIAELQQKEKQALNDYWTKQPELQEAAFISQLQTAYEEERKDPKKRVIPIWELAKYLAVIAQNEGCELCDATKQQAWNPRQTKEVVSFLYSMGFVRPLTNKHPVQDVARILFCYNLI